MAVQRHHHLQRVPATWPEQAVERMERRGTVAVIDGVGEVPGRNASTLAEERLELSGVDAGALAVGGLEHVEDRRQPSDILAEMVGEKPCGRGVETQPRGGKARHHPAGPRPTLPGGGVDDPPGCLDDLREILGDPAVRHDNEDVALDSVAEAGGELGALGGDEALGPSQHDDATV